MMRAVVEIINERGMHGRPAQIFSELARGYAAEVEVSSKGRIANGKVMADLLTLGAACGDTLAIESNDAAAVAALVALVGRRFGEPF